MIALGLMCRPSGPPPGLWMQSHLVPGPDDPGRGYVNPPGLCRRLCRVPARPDLRGGDLNCAWIKYCDTTTGNQVATRENKPYSKHKRIALLTRNCGGALFTLYKVIRRSRVIAVVRWMNQ